MKLSGKNKLLPLLPALLVTLIMAAAGLLMAVSESFTSPSGEKNPSAYNELFADSSFQVSVLYSLNITIVSTILSIMIGLIIVRSTYSFLQKRHWKLAAWLPMLFPHFVWGYLLFLLFSQSGWISTLAFELGIINSIDEFPEIMKASNGLGIILTYVWKEVPFVILMLLPIYQQMDVKRKDIVYTLGGSGWHAFKAVEWPMLVPSLIEIAFILFAFIFAAYEVPALLGATYPKMISVLTIDWFYSGDWSKRPLAFAAMVMTSIVILLCLYCMYLSLNRHRERAAKGSVIEKTENKTPSKLLFMITLTAFVFPVLFVMVKSVSVSWSLGDIFPAGFSLRGWKILAQEPKLAEALINSVEIGLWVIVLNLFLGIPAAKTLAHVSFKGKAAVETILLTPIIVPALTIAMGLHVVFIRAGLADNMAGVVIIQLLPTLPYTIKVIRSGFERIGVKWEEQANTLGASKGSVLFRIYFPQLLPSFRSVVFLVMTISLSQYLLTALIGGGSVITLASLFFPYFQSADDAVIASFSILFALVPVFIWIFFESVFRLAIPYRKR
jgi:ABC-type Fe3+ transport system permease subunit